MSIGFVAIGLLSGVTAALFALQAGSGLPGALLAYAGVGALALLVCAVPRGLNESRSLV